MREYRKLGEMLVARGVISSLQLSVALAAQQTSSRRLGEILVERAFASEQAIASCLAEQYGYALDDLSETRPEKEALHLVTPEVAVSHLILPLRVTGAEMECVICDPIDVLSTDVVSRITGMKLTARLATQSALTAAIRRAYGLVEEVPEGFARWEAGLPDRYTDLHPRRRIGDVALFDAADTVLPRKVTLSSISIDSQGIDALDTMVKAVACIRSGRVSAVYDAFTSGGQNWTVFEHLEGESLDHILATRGPRTPAQAAQLVSEIAEGVDALNRRRGICGTIVCPANILVRPDGAMLMPFARPPLEFVPPEVLNGELPSLSSDVFPLGVLLWHCVTGRDPRELADGASLDLLRDETNEMMPLVLRDVLTRCLAPKPLDRFSSSLQLCQALKAQNWSIVANVRRRVSEGSDDRDALLDSVTVKPKRSRTWREWLFGRKAA